MVAFVVLRTTIVHVVAVAALRLLCLTLSRDRASAVPAFDQVGGVGHLVLLVDLLADQSLNPIPKLTGDDRFVCSGMPFISELDLPDVGTVGEDRVELAASEFRRRREPVDAFSNQSISKRIERMVVVGIEFEDSADFCRVLRVKLDNASTVDADVSVAVGWATGKEPARNPSLNSLFHVDALLLRVE